MSCADVGQYLSSQYGERMKGAEMFERLVKLGRLGEKSGAGFYSYGDQSDEPVKQIIAELSAGKHSEFTPERLMYPMLNEAARCVEEGIADVKDMDMAMIAGTGMTYKGERIGPLALADKLGLDVIVAGLEEFEKKYGLRFHPVRQVVPTRQGRSPRRKDQGGFPGVCLAVFAHEGHRDRKELVSLRVLRGGKKEELMADRQYIRYTIEERVATVVIDHPPANALNKQTLTELDGAIDELLANSEVKVIIITGGGQMAFVAGADIGEINDLVKSGNAAGAQAMIEMGQAVFNKIEQSPKPIIAAINGFCLGGGLEMAMACHIRICRRPRAAGPARDQPGHHPRLGRHAAAAAPGEQGQGHRDHFDRRPNHRAGSQGTGADQHRRARRCGDAPGYRLGAQAGGQERRCRGCGVGGHYRWRWPPPARWAGQGARTVRQAGRQRRHP